MTALNYWLKERRNPQFTKPYYVRYGQLTIKEAEKIGNSRHGKNYILRFKTKKEYENKIKRLKTQGFSIR